VKGSTVEIMADGSIQVVFSAGPRWLGCWAPRTMWVSASDVRGMWRSDPRFVGRRLRWKIAGGGFSRLRLMGWFSWIGNPGRWAWVWITPRRALLVIETVNRKPALIAVPLDWVRSTNESAKVLDQLVEWSG
jgi:hypothetical protein